MVRPQIATCSTELLFPHALDVRMGQKTTSLYSSFLLYMLSKISSILLGVSEIDIDSAGIGNERDFRLAFVHRKRSLDLRLSMMRMVLSWNQHTDWNCVDQRREWFFLGIELQCGLDDSLCWLHDLCLVLS